MLVYSDTTEMCTCCGRVLPVEAFSPDARKANGLHSHCRKCRAVAAAAARQRAKVRIWRNAFYGEHSQKGNYKFEKKEYNLLLNR